MWTLNKFLFLLPVAFIAGTAQTLPTQPIPGQDPTNCMSSMFAIPNCIPEIIQSLVNGEIGTVGHSCCHAFLGLRTDCITEMFDFTPEDFPPALRDYCSRQ
ncbi:Prolamin-like domain-containing protein [Hirschfeldia incana]|nr:Prolamin-like domain-containing protein [Hirschfeldia incana]